MADGPPWTTPSALGEYAFCPRAHFYRQHEESAPTPEATEGQAFHRRQLSSERWRDEHPRIPWLAVACGVGLVVLAVAVGAL